jgi:hypothetical protein
MTTSPGFSVEITNLASRTPEEKKYGLNCWLPVHALTIRGHLE